MSDRPLPPLETALHIVATPIGAADDITLRALNILRSADILAAEDTRRLRHLMDIHSVALQGRRLVSYHDHSPEKARRFLVDAIAAGKSVAYASDAGTPLIADPGFALVRDCVAEGLVVRAAPGASALLTALAVAGMPTDRFFFGGFPPQKAQARKNFLREVTAIPATLILYESPHRIAQTFADLSDIAADRPAAMCRELTKRFEEIRRASVGQIAAELAEEPTPKGEIVVVLAPPLAKIWGDTEIERALVKALETLSVKDAASFVADASGLPKTLIYKRALALKE